MAKNRTGPDEFARPIRRILVGGLVLLLLAIFLLWRIDSPRVERFRAALVDRIVPNLDWAMAPVTRAAAMIEDFQSYTRIYEQNQELRRELQQMKAWKEAALQLEQKNARLLDLNQVRLDPNLTHVTGVVLADSGSPFRQSVLLNVGARDGIRDGWAAMDGIGLVGRISGVGRATARVILLTDSNSRIPVTVQPSGQRALLSGDNSPAPPLEFLEKPDLVRPGDRVVTSGDGGVFPAGLMVGEVALGPDRRLRVRLSADYQRLEFLRVLRSHELEPITDPGALVAPPIAPPCRPPPNPHPSPQRPRPEMVDPVRADLWLHRGIFVAVALVLLFLRLLPLGGLAGEWPGPDLLMCLVLAWVLRRPDYLPALLIALVVLVEDFVLMRPPGLWAAIVLLASEFLRSRAALTRELSFVAEWLMVAGLMLAMLLGYRLVFAVAFLPQPDFGYAMVQSVVTMLCYPAVVGLSWLALDVRKPAMGEVDAMGRRL
ncbi:rod shape-determining protein MreC [Paracoccaceae bacterium Fryx2]|nr:rod shape-determining protein MreC [Paracoccaceae bacterium Fryx2]